MAGALTNRGAGRCHKGGFWGSDVFLGLHTAKPTSGNEVTKATDGLSRVEIDPAEVTVTNNVAKVNANQNFGNANKDVSDPTHVGYWDASTGGNLLAWSTIEDAGGSDTTLQIVSGSPVTLPKDGVSLTIPLTSA